MSCRIFKYLLASCLFLSHTHQVIASKFVDKQMLQESRGFYDDRLIKYKEKSLDKVSKKHTSKANPSRKTNSNSQRDNYETSIEELQAALDKKQIEHEKVLKKIRKCNIKLAELDKRSVEISRKIEEENRNFLKISKQLSRDRALHEAKYENIFGFIKDQAVGKLEARNSQAIANEFVDKRMSENPCKHADGKLIKDEVKSLDRAAKQRASKADASRTTVSNSQRDNYETSIKELEAELDKKEREIKETLKEIRKYYIKLAKLDKTVKDEVKSLNKISKKCTSKAHVRKVIKKEDQQEDTMSEKPFPIKAFSYFKSATNTINNAILICKTSLSSVLSNIYSRITASNSTQDNYETSIEELQAELAKKEKELKEPLEKISECDIKLEELDKRGAEISRKIEEENRNFLQISKQLSRDRALHESRYENIFGVYRGLNS